jgi:hypothetical protein
MNSTANANLNNTTININNNDSSISYSTTDSEKLNVDSNNINLNKTKNQIHTETNSLLKDELTVIDIEKDINVSMGSTKISNQNKFEQKVRIGRMFAFWYNKYGEPRIVIGPHCNISIFKFFIL